MLCQLPYHNRAVDGHADNVAKHHPNDDAGLELLTPFRQTQQGVLKVRHEDSIGRSQRHDITPRLGAFDNVGQLFGKPIVVSFDGIAASRSRKGIAGRKLQIADDFGFGDIPQFVVMVVVMSPQNIVDGVSHITEFVGGLVFAFVPRRIVVVAAFPKAGKEGHFLLFVVVIAWVVVVVVVVVVVSCRGFNVVVGRV